MKLRFAKCVLLFVSRSSNCWDRRIENQNHFIALASLLRRELKYCLELFGIEKSASVYNCMKVKSQDNPSIKSTILEFLSLPHWNKMMSYLRDSLKARSEFDIVSSCFPKIQTGFFRPQVKHFHTNRFISSDCALFDLKLRLHNHTLSSYPHINRRKNVLKSNTCDKNFGIKYGSELTAESTSNSSAYDELPFVFNATQCMGRYV